MHFTILLTLLVLLVVMPMGGRWQFNMIVIVVHGGEGVVVEVLVPG